MESSFVVAFLIYFFVGISSLFVNKPTFWKVVGKFLHLAGMLFVGGFVFLIFVDDAPEIGIPLSFIILGLSLWRSFRW